MEKSVFLHQGRTMLTIKRIFFFAAAAVILPVNPASALGQKPVRDASYYVQELNVVQQEPSDYVPPVSETKILAKCGDTGLGNDAVGILITDKGEAYGYSGQTPVDRHEPSVLLVKNKEDIDKILKYADSVRLETFDFNEYPESAAVCGLDYLKDFKVYSTVWAKHPYLRETNPPPEELILIFEAVNNVVKKVPVFPEDPAEKTKNVPPQAEKSAIQNAS